MQNSLRRSRMPMHFLFRPLSRVTGTPPWLLRPMRVFTSSELYPDTWLFFVFECIGIQFFNSLTYGTPCHARGLLHSLTCDLQDVMPRQRSLSLIPREAEDFPRGDQHFKHVPPPTYLICWSPKDLYGRSPEFVNNLPSMGFESFSR